MTEQETFETVVNHLRKQGKKAKDPKGVGASACKYRYGDLKCAAGCLIPDDKYTPALEGRSIYTYQTTDGHEYLSDAGLIIEALGHNVKLVSALQSVHDTVRVEYWEREIRHIAAEFNLNYTPTGGQVC